MKSRPLGSMLFVSLVALVGATLAVLVPEDIQAEPVDLVARLKESPREAARATALVADMLNEAEAVWTQPVPARRALVGMAEASRDPVVYGLGFKACALAPADTDGCDRLGAARWAQLDPGNALPWLHELRRVVESKDEAAVGELLHRIGASPRSASGTFAGSAEVLREVPDNEGGADEVVAMVVRLIAFEAMAVLPIYQPVLKLCRGDALQDANRRQACETVATLFTQRSDTLLERQMGSALGGNLGWSASRLEALKREREGLLGFSQRLAPTDGANAATAQRTLLRYIRRANQIGEVGALREIKAGSPVGAVPTTR